MCAAGLLLVGQLVRWQVVEHHRFIAWAEAEHQDEIVIPARRGEIRDRAGHLLATDLIDYNVSASPKIIADLQGTAARLAEHLNLSEEEILSQFDPDKVWVHLENGVSQQAGEAILKMDIVGVQVESNARRVYPEGALAAHILGFVNDNGNGFYGIEGYYDTLLKGKPGLLEGERSPFGDLIPLGSSRFMPPTTGSTLYLTIDRSVQFLIEEELEKAVRKYRAQGGSVVVLNPKTGAVSGDDLLPIL